MLYTVLFVYFIYNLVCIFLCACCEDRHLVVERHLFYEVLGIWTDMEYVLVHVEMNEGLVEVQDEVSGVVGG